MTSKPEVRMRILTELEKLGAVRGETIEDLKARLNMLDVSNTQFTLALRSLHYRYRRVHLGRPHAWGPFRGPRAYDVTYLSEDDRSPIPVVQHFSATHA